MNSRRDQESPIWLDWGQVPGWANWVGAGSNGLVVAYRNKPTKQVYISGRVAYWPSPEGSLFQVLWDEQHMDVAGKLFKRPKESNMTFFDLDRPQMFLDDRQVVIKYKDGSMFRPYLAAIGKAQTIYVWPNEKPGSAVKYDLSQTIKISDDAWAAIGELNPEEEYMTREEAIIFCMHRPVLVTGPYMNFAWRPGVTCGFNQSIKDYEFIHTMFTGKRMGVPKKFLRKYLKARII